MNKNQNEDPRRGSKNSQTWRALAQVSQIGITMAATVLAGILLGKYLDAWLGTAPWLLLVFSLLGAGAAIRTLLKLPNDKQ